jgi:hypothetical protein
LMDGRTLADGSKLFYFGYMNRHATEVNDSRSVPDNSFDQAPCRSPAADELSSRPSRARLHGEDAEDVYREVLVERQNGAGHSKSQRVSRSALTFLKSRKRRRERKSRRQRFLRRMDR